MTVPLPRDTELRLPDLTVVSASAGAGKTYTLAFKVLQLLLSRCIPFNALRNIVALTFTNNAAAEMKQRILEYLKRASFGDAEVMDELRGLVAMEEEDIRSACAEMVVNILDHYSDFQIQTIDSFLSRVFRASALDVGFSPSTEIILDSSAILDEAFDEFARTLASDPVQRILLDQLVEILLENQTASSKFLWDPFDALVRKVRDLYGKLAAQSGDVLLQPVSAKDIAAKREEFREVFHRLVAAVAESKLAVSKNFQAAVDTAASGMIDDIVRRKSVYNAPVKKSGVAPDEYNRWLPVFSPLQKQLAEIARTLMILQARQYYQPYVHAHRLFRKTIDHIMRERGQIPLADVVHALVRYVNDESVPQIYFYLGEAVRHYLIDEFQDTAPIQWKTFQPLIAEALSKEGSAFIVGDMKQSIYAFRHADWRIMKSLIETNVFPSAPPRVCKLETNFRSGERILDFTKHVFHSIVPANTDSTAASASGLSTFQQEAEQGKKGKGYVELVSFEPNAEPTAPHAHLLAIVANCVARGYSYRDITILTPKNKHVVAISERLNTVRIPFVSHSNLDIRGRKTTVELLQLLQFLDSPLDDLSFASFLLGELVARALHERGRVLGKDAIHEFLFRARRDSRAKPLYTIFRSQFPAIWNDIFEEHFTLVGYLPMYDLVSGIFKRLNVFEVAGEEEGALVKFLEIIKAFEARGANNLRDFLQFAEDEEDESWNVAAPTGSNAVSVMTVHKAKGLGNRVVVLLLEDARTKHDNLFFEEDEEGVRLVRITKDIVEADESLAELYHRRVMENAVDDLNKLYVALTRAEEEMYIISVKSERSDDPSKFLPAKGYAPSEKLPVEPKPRQEANVAPTAHSTKAVPSTVQSVETFGVAERRRGEVIHALLEAIEFVDGSTPTRLNTAFDSIDISWQAEFNRDGMVRLVETFLQLPEVCPLFERTNNRRIRNEQEFVAADGRSVRMDRVLVDTDAVTVVDFKTGDDHEEYTNQVRDYMNVLRDLFAGKTVRGVLAFVDRKSLRWVA